MKRIRASETDPEVFHRYMTGSFAPRPIVLMSTISTAGKFCLKPSNYYLLMGIDPPMVVFSPTPGAVLDESLQNLREVPEVVINLVDVSMVNQTSLAFLPTDHDSDGFKKAGFTPAASELIRPPRVEESLVQLECRVLEIRTFSAVSLIAAEILLAHISEKILDNRGRIDSRKTRWALHFEEEFATGLQQYAKRSVARTAIGVDSLPLSVRRSAILSGNDLGILGSLPALPSETEIRRYACNEVVVSMRNQTNGVCENFNELLHIRVKELLNEGKVEEALLAALQSH